MGINHLLQTDYPQFTSTMLFSHFLLVSYSTFSSSMLTVSSSKVDSPFITLPAVFELESKFEKSYVQYVKAPIYFEQPCSVQYTS